MTKEEIQKEIDYLLERMGKLIKSSEPLEMFSVEGHLRKSFEQIFAASIRIKDVVAKPDPPKLLRRTLF